MGPLPSVYRVSNDRKAIGAHKRSHEIRVVWGVRRARRSGFEAFGGRVEILGMHGLEGIIRPLGPSAGSTASLTVRGFDFAEFYVP